MVGKPQHPLAPRIKRLMQADEDVGKIAQLTPSVVASALEQLVRQLCTGGTSVAQERGARTLTPSHLRTYILAEPKLDFLKEAVANVAELAPADAEPPRPAKRPRPAKAGKGKQSADPAAADTVKARPYRKKEGSAVKAESVTEQDGLPVRAGNEPQRNDALKPEPTNDAARSPITSNNTVPAEAQEPHGQVRPKVEINPAAEEAQQEADSKPAATVQSATLSSLQPGRVPGLPAAAHASFEDEDDYDAE